MKISLIAVGKTGDRSVADLVSAYSKRVDRYADLEIVEVPDDGDGSSSKLSKAMDKCDRAFLLDEFGREYRSVELADLVQRQMNSGIKTIGFIIGGPFGFSKEIREHPRVLQGGTIALSKMTFPHDLVRVIFLEQLYRALTILRNEKYHHE